MKIICRCGNSFEVPRVRVNQFHKLAFGDGWRWRGTVTGVVYTCPRHSPKQAKDK